LGDANNATSDAAERLVERLSPYLADAQQPSERISVTEQLAKLLSNDRKYAIELAPKVAYCRGKLVDLVINTGIGDHVQFKGVEHNYIARDDDAIERVPDSKGDIFASDSLSLIEKRKLMKLMTSIDDDKLTEECADDMSFAQFLKTRFKLSGKLLDSVLYAVARVEKRDELSARAGCARVQKYVRSIGRYGRMAYLCAMYGGGSEIAQSFCRLCAVSGGTYILSERVGSVEKRDDDTGYAVQLSHGRVFAKHVVLDPSYLPDSEPTDCAVSRAVCILDNPVLGDETTAILSYVVDVGVVSVLYTTQATLAAPSGQSVVYLWTSGRLSDTRALLLSALNKVCGSLARPLFTALFETRDMKPVHDALPGLCYTAAPDSTLDFDSAVDRALEIVADIA
ncbi:hypothetical protein GGI21_003275, partial [Coemansia aciculifera]